MDNGALYAADIKKIIKAKDEFFLRGAKIVVAPASTTSIDGAIPLPEFSVFTSWKGQRIDRRAVYNLISREV